MARIKEVKARSSTMRVVQEKSNIKPIIKTVKAPCQKARSHQNPFLADSETIVVTRTQINFVIALRTFRSGNDFTIYDIARIFSLRGEAYGIKFSPSEISRYENFAVAPSTPKFQIILSVLNLTEDDIR